MKNFDIQLINDASLRHKWQNLCTILQKAGENGLLVAFSGGTDSTLLLAAAHYAGVMPLMGVSLVTPLQTPGDRENILSLQESLDLPIIFLESDPLTLPEVRMNRKDRCYHCKKQLFSQILETAKKEGIPAVAEGSHAGDRKEYRPGAEAIRELGILSPLADAELDKPEIRALARLMDLPNADLPASPCLATRFPYDTELTEEALTRAAQGEQLLHELGFSECRLRVHGDLARIEIPVSMLQQLTAYRDNLIPALKALGFRYITCDMEGYKSGRFDQ